MFFKEQIKKRIKNEKGLTLVELLAVIVILAIIAAIAIPAIGNIIANSRAKAIISDAQNMMNAANIYYTDGNVDLFTNTGTKITTGGYVESFGKISVVEVANTNPRTIKFTADWAGKSVTAEGLTLDDLNAIKVSGGNFEKPTLDTGKKFQVDGKDL